MQWRWGWRHNQFSFVQLVPHTFGGRTLCFLEVFKADSGCYAHVPFQPLILAWRLDPTHIVYKVKYEETIGSCGPRNDCNICCVCLLEPSWCIDIVLDRVVVSARDFPHYLGLHRSRLCDLAYRQNTTQARSLVLMVFSFTFYLLGTSAATALFGLPCPSPC